jgi:hypothetical protein
VDEEEAARFFDGVELVEPGLVQVAEWRPDSPSPGSPPPADAKMAETRRGGRWAGVGQKPIMPS